MSHRMIQPGRARDKERPARCRTCGVDAETEAERRKHEEHTGHRLWQLLVHGSAEGSLLTRN